jgi:hypothetical protein
VALNTIKHVTAPYCNGFFMRILNYQMSAINYVLLSNDICKGVKRVIIDKGGLFDIHNDLNFPITSKIASLMAFCDIDQSNFTSEVFWLLNLTFSGYFRCYWEI